MLSHDEDLDSEGLPRDSFRESEMEIQDEDHVFKPDILGCDPERFVIVLKTTSVINQESNRLSFSKMTSASHVNNLHVVPHVFICISVPLDRDLRYER